MLAVDCSKSPNPSRLPPYDPAMTCDHKVIAPQSSWLFLSLPNLGSILSDGDWQCTP
ncbi:protein of unknown function [Cyanobium sp. NIES-981]|nr:protein of unknown function [Cyanobium sp. NIES-981]